MEKNTDADTIVMHRSIFEELFESAEAENDAEFLRRMQKHVFKFNPIYRTERVRERLMGEQERRDKIRNSRDFVKKRQGQPTYIWTDVLGAVRVVLRGVSTTCGRVMFRSHDDETVRIKAAADVAAVKSTAEHGHDRLELSARLRIYLATGYNVPLNMSMRMHPSHFYSTAEAAEKDNKK